MKLVQEQTHVLLAEDDEDDVIFFKLAIGSIPILIKLRTAVDGEMLFVLLREELPDVIFLDINMPCKDGVACIVEIRKNSDYNNIPVIMYTSLKNSRYIDKCFESGANFYVTKSNTVAELAEKLKRIFSINWKEHLYYPAKSDFVLDAV